MSLQDRFQSIVHSIDEGLGLTLARGLIVVIVIGGLFGLYAFTQFRGLKEPAAMDAAQVARNLAEGRGMTTRCIRPFDIGQLEEIGRGDFDVHGFPEVRIPPLYPALLAVAFSVVQPSFDPSMNWKRYDPEVAAICRLQAC